jgi:monofunctional glycosyltransferase
VKRAFFIILFLGGCFIGFSLFFTIVYKWIPVRTTPLMIIRCAEQVAGGKPLKLNHHWVSRDKISKNLKLAVICSEDQNFVTHSGFDLEAIDKAIKESKTRKRVRGASTISQQTAKNVFLWPGRSWIRKGLEVWFTALIELFWSKERILQVYLNSIEMGNGIYGAEAAAGIYFKTTADKLTVRQSAAIAAILPNPRKYNASNPGPYVSGRIGWIMEQMQQYGPLEMK